MTTEGQLRERPPSSTSTTPLKILIVEDEPSARSGLAKAVIELGFNVRAAADGEEAWQLHRRSPADVILSDWRMPRLDGYELCKRTRAAEDEHYTYFIFMTALADKEHFLRAMEAGADDYLTKPIDLDELRARLLSAARVMKLHRKLAERTRVLRRDSQRFFHDARVDALTDIPNRLCLREDLEALGARMARYGHRYSVGIADVDHFKDYNDRFGHLEGDVTLRNIAACIRDHLRVGDTLYRYGGEEFLVILPEQSLSAAAGAMDRVRSAVEKRGSVTISVGVAELDAAKKESPDGWLRRADAALYRAKGGGRNRVEVDG